jgi:cell shape-determining protein MreD
MATFLSLPILGLAVMLQMAVFSRLDLLSGNIDLVLLIVVAWSLQERVRTSWVWALVAGALVGFVSGLHWLVPVVSYLLSVGCARLLTRRIWQAPLLAMFLVTALGTLLMHALSFAVLNLFGHALPLGDSFVVVFLPGLLLNLLVSIPVHSMVRDLANRLYPVEVKA